MCVSYIRRVLSNHVSMQQPLLITVGKAVTQFLPAVSSFKGVAVMKAANILHKEKTET